VKHKSSVCVAGMVSRFRKHLTKSGNDMAFVTLDDLYGSMDIVVFPSVWNGSRDLIEIDRIVIIDGKVDNVNGDPKILADSIRSVSNDELSTVLEQGQNTEIHLEPPVVDLRSRYEIEFGGADLEQEEAQAVLQVDEFNLESMMDADELDDSMDPFFDPTFFENLENLSELEEPQEKASNLQVPEKREQLPKPEEVLQVPAEKPVLQEIPDQPYKKNIDIAPDVNPGVNEDPGGNNLQGRLFQPKTNNPGQNQILDRPAPPKKPLVTIPAIDKVFDFRDPKKDEFRMLTIILRPNPKDFGRGHMQMRRVVNVLRSYPGKDKFGLMIFENGKRVALEFPNDTTGYCPELMRRLKDMVGEENIQVKVLKVH
jgi:hypothetical protein